MKENYMLKLQQ